MVTVNYQVFGTKGFQLRLRLYQSGETKYINVTKLLKGVIYRKHWNQKKQQFIASCPFSEENNRILVEFRQKYDLKAVSWNGSLYGMMLAMEEEEQGGQDNTLKGFICSIVEGLKENKHSDGSVKGTYEGYEKLSRRLEEFCEAKRVKYEKILIGDVNAKFVDDLFVWMDKAHEGKGLMYVSKMMHAVLVRADKAGLTDINQFKGCAWRNKKPASSQKFNTLSPDQCRRFASLTPDQLPPNRNAELFHDFCVFLLYTGQSPCDALTLKHQDIKEVDGVDHFVFKRRKISEKQHLPCAVPINPVMRRIMERWKPLSHDGYVFPIRSRKRIKECGMTNADIKHFISRLNMWLKKAGKLIDCTFPLHTYTFRHTAITNYLSKDIPVIYVANLMGTSVENCEKIYYNNLGDRESRKKVLDAVLF